jgi:hypothetical protein
VQLNFTFAIIITARTSLLLGLILFEQEYLGYMQIETTCGLLYRCKGNSIFYFSSPAV